jgi:hypothetical protein
MPEAEVKIQVSKDGTHLVAGDDLTLYYFLPQSHDPKHAGLIPYMSQFPVSSQAWIMQWKPLVGDPVFISHGKDHGVDQDDFSVTERLGGPDETDDQIMFRMWYVYAFKDDKPGQVGGEVAGIWQKVPPELKKLSDKPGFPLENFKGGP